MIALPLALIGLVFVHIVALHEVGSNNPDGIEIKKHKGADGVPLDGVAFHPYHTSKDLVAIIIFLMIFSCVVFFAPEMGGYFLEHANFEPANMTATPEHIAPVWYFTPFYAILRAVPDKLWGFILFGLSVVLPVFLPWLDRARVKSIRYRGWIYKSALTVFVITSCRSVGWACSRLKVSTFCGADLLGSLFRILPVDAVLHDDRQDEACTGQGGLAWISERCSRSLWRSADSSASQRCGRWWR